MKIHNIRVGFATNSSSTHSLAFMPGKRDKGAGNGDFGWGTFRLASPEAKARWLAQHFIHTASTTCGLEISQALASHWLGFDPSSHSDDYIDHQSVIDLPRGWDGKGVDVQFFNELRDFVMTPGMVVLGGNDNEPTPRGEVDYRSVLPTDGCRSWVNVARKDSRGYWTIFNRNDGTKYRAAFGDKSLSSVAPDKADTPELVDVKITDFCPYNCSMCYQGSTVKGAHASDTMLSEIYFYMKDSKVFEVAIGGGEPTLHPKFDSILRSFQDAGVVPNFTSRNLAWLRDPSMSGPILDASGAWAYSTEDPEQIEKLHALCVTLGIPQNKRPNIQYIVGIGDTYKFERVLSACAKANFRVTLLGPKDTGRGKGTNWSQFDWLQVVKKLSHEEGLNFGVDTALVQKYGDEIEAAGIPSWCYTKHEGKFSMYIDAVKGTFGPSSYGDPSEMRPWPKYGPGWVDEINTEFGKW